jgi:uncharacterized protein HemX
LRPDETKHPPEETPEEETKTQETPAAPPGEEKKPASPSRAVTTYFLVLFLAAVFLLLISFGMQQRNHQALLDLNDSVTATQDLANAQLENQQLNYDLADLQEDYDQLQADQEALTQEKADLEQQIQAVESLRQIQAAVSSSLDKAKELVDAFEASGLKDSLPQDPVVEGGTSPAQDYQTIYDMFY